MPTLNVINSSKKAVGTIDLSEELFGQVGNPHVVWEVVRAYLAARRRGTAATKTRGEVSGGGKKPWKQKGTGRARVGSSRNPLWRHGGTAHGPQPRDYTTGISRQKRRVAVRRVLASMLASERVTVLDNLDVAEPKTGAFRRLLDGIGIPEKALLLVREPGENLKRASSNLKGLAVVVPEAVNAYDLLRYRHLVATQDGLARLQEVLSR